MHSYILWCFELLSCNSSESFSTFQFSYLFAFLYATPPPLLPNSPTRFPYFLNLYVKSWESCEEVNQSPAVAPFQFRGNEDMRICKCCLILIDLCSIDALESIHRLIKGEENSLRCFLVGASN